MIMRSLNDDDFDSFFSGDQNPPEWSVNCGDDAICCDWRFVPLDPCQHRRIDAAHTSIAAPHMPRTLRPAVPESESDFNQALYFG
ncbi:MAG: hypothetical protein GY903_05765 [Fuerstiella sp.]|nr:hypothetical protein [Fuerstiella sp.]MCP4853980.1 hypothetical protein [Fuerstiella sp.]